MTGDNIDTIVRSFRELLNAAWPALRSVASAVEDEQFVDDWLQANWEMFVEARLPPGVNLEIYGSGADCNDDSSRVSRPSARATHRVVCKPKGELRHCTDVLSGEEILIPETGVALDELVARCDQWYARDVPFDHVLVEGPALFRIEEIELRLDPIED